MKLFGTDVNLVSVWDVVQTLVGRRGHTAPSDKQEAGLKAGFMGISKNDEALFDDAVAQAFKEETDDKILLKKVRGLRKVFAKLDHGERKRLFQTIGINEQEIIETEPKSVEYTDGKGNTRVKIDRKEKKYKINERGKRFIQFLSRLSVNEAVLFLKASGTLTGPVDDLGHFWSVAKPFLVDTWNSIEARRRTQGAILWYIGARTLEEAEAVVSVRELALANRQGQSWHAREAQRPREFQIWVALIVFSVAAFVYVFAFSH